ncbi:alpha/beta hydrolase [Alkalihalobacillus sp. MEB130]|uniref:alpha/beta hydrolase n=1 Tax=Alkalihalobacillus sp. MEB130 TaxID=2976704 RepID=UPI0028DD9C3E|nr:alpha/beta hydrolase [Alkalihalobacillus sp. MEB130]MDT8859619.1 alpha/beta hydrolase [Alkalihalobacillus sp. MEB130]
MVRARFFRIEEQWNVIYLPERPNGFAVFLIGNNGMLVDKDTSDWEHHPEKNQFLDDLLSRGYTVVASSLYNQHWGSPRAFHLFEKLYSLVLKKEILNSKVHLFAQGSGALLAIRFLQAYSGKVRSCYFVNPCFSLEAYFAQEQENKLYFKRFKKEIAEAYQLPLQEVNSNKIIKLSPSIMKSDLPPLSIHCHVQEKHFPLQTQSRPFQQELANRQIFVNLRIHGNDKSFYKAAQSAFPFYKKYEVIL